MTTYNFKSAIDNGWSPKWFGVEKFSSKLLDAIEDFQKANALKPDGFCGPQTFKILKDQRPKENKIICGINHFAINHKVVLWNDEEGLAAKKGSYRENYKTRDIKLMVNHWDVCKRSKDTIKIMNKKNISCQFLIDWDGCIYQTMNADHIAWHAGGRSWNNHSVGVEICNPYYTKYQDKRRPRPIMRRKKVHGRTMSEHLGFYPKQLTALKKLWKIMALAYGIPLQTPTNRDGSELGGVHKESVNVKYRGFIHHYNLTRSKIDCGSLDLTELIDEMNWK